jgi:WD40 repeat protein
MTRNPETAIFARTGSDVEAMTFDPPGRKLMALTVDGRLQHWDRESGVLLAEHALVPAPKPKRGVLAALSPSLVALSLPNAGVVRLWDAATGAERQEFAVGGQVSCLAFSPKGRQLAVGVLSKGGAFVTVREPATGRELGWLPLPALPTALTFRDDDWLAWGTNRGHAGLVHWRSGRTAALGPHRGAILALAFSPDRLLLASAGEDDAAVFLSRLSLPAEGRPSWSSAGRIESPTGLCGLAFSPDGQRLAGVTRDVVKLWDPKGKLEMLTLRGSPQRYWDGPYSPRIAFSPDGAGLAGTNWDESVSLWEAEDAGGAEPAETLRRRAWRLAEERAVYWHLQEAEQCLRFHNPGAARFHLQRMGDAPLSPPLMARREALRAKMAAQEE